MRLEDLIKLDISDNNVLIIGCPASGKTYLSSKISKPTHRIIHTDDYNYLGYEMAMYAALDVIMMSEQPTIVEGVSGYRMLRKGAENGSYYPDIVIELETSDQRVKDTYQQERDEKKLGRLKNFVSSNSKILDEYRAIVPENKKPRWINVFNNY